jgi:hypothetical protein
MVPCAMLESLNEYPRWFVLACAFVAAGGVLWLLVKLLKLALWMFFSALAVAAVVMLAGYFLR